jgi:nucleotide-binding universal stress UspA family protein
LGIVEQGQVLSDLLWGPGVQLALSGHPALIVPRGWESKRFGHRVLIAWNGSAQAAAALRRALPLLQQSDHVTLLVGSSREAFPYAMRMPLLDPSAYLRRQGITTELKLLEAPDADAGEAILKLAEDEKIDLIVMGAFGRSRFREWILGGATRHVFENMTVPVFMSHQ